METTTINASPPNNDDQEGITMLMDGVDSGAFRKDKEVSFQFLQRGTF